MPRTETYEEVFTYFEEWEDEKIEGWLKERDYVWGFPTLCGSCCGFWDAEYWVQLRPDDIAAFNAFAATEGIGAIASTGRIRIGSPDSNTGGRPE